MSQTAITEIDSIESKYELMKLWHDEAQGKVNDAFYTLSGLYQLIHSFRHDNEGVLTWYYDTLTETDKTETLPEVWDKIIDVLGFLENDLKSASERITAYE